MIILNLSNIEDLIFYDNKVKQKLPDFSDTFKQWAFAKQFSNFRQLVKRTLSDFLGSLTEQHIEILSQYFGTNVSIDNLDYHIVKNHTFDVDTTHLQEMIGFTLSISRYRDNIYVTFWR